MFTLKQLGWNDYFENKFKEFKQNGFIAARVAVENKQRYILLTEAGELTGEVTGKLLYTTDSISELPKTGDWVAAILFEDEKKAIIHEVLERRTKLSRKVADKKTDEQVIAANVDIVFIVQSLDSNFNLRRLERYLSITNESKAEPFIILNKADLSDDVEKKKELVRKVTPSIKIIITDAINNKGIDKLSSTIREGVTAVFIGSSGVGKSTLINCLIGEDKIKTQQISEAVGKGKHTTTKREMILLPQGGIIIDTPGMRELGLWSTGSGVDETFADIKQLAEDCKFRDCTHTQEIGCAVLKAIETGEFDESRLKSYHKLQKEIKFLEERKEKSLDQIKKEKWKQIHKEIKRYYKKRNDF